MSANQTPAGRLTREQHARGRLALAVIEVAESKRRGDLSDRYREHCAAYERAVDAYRDAVRAALAADGETPPAPVADLARLTAENEKLRGELLRLRTDRGIYDRRAYLDAQANVARLTAERDRLREALERVLAYEVDVAKLDGVSDCTCINFDGDTERAYEAGRCPHQQARAALADTEGAR